MRKLKNVYPITELHSFAQDKNFSTWNETEALLNKNFDFINHTIIIYKSEIANISNEKMRYILYEFFEEENIEEEITFIED